MRGIQIEDGGILYFGNKAGYIRNRRAVIDLIFKGEAMERFLRKQGSIEMVEWVGGVYDRLMNGGSETQGEGVLKNCRIWQLKPEVDVHMKFIGYDALIRKFGEPEPQNYRTVYDGEIETNDLDRICAKFSGEQKIPDYDGHVITISDVIELYDEDGSLFYYVDTNDFRPVAFGGPEPVQTQMIQL